MVGQPTPYTQHTLENGLRILVESMPDVRSAAAGFLVRTGARDETPDLAGVSHFLEHMMFKGTARRTWRDINVDFDRLGSTYNAFTSEDRTVYYGWVRAADIERQIDLLADMLRSTLPHDEFNMERNVILEEIAMSRDSLEHRAVDFIQERVFTGHPLAWPVLGYDRTVRSLSRDAMWNYFQKRYAPDNIVLVVTGNVEPGKIIECAHRCCADWPRSGATDHRTPPSIKGGVDLLPLDRFHQQVIVLTFPAVDARSPLAETASAVATLLGGDNSRFFWNIVQKGICTRAGAYYMDLTDCGAMLLYGTCQPEDAERLTDALRAELDRISTEPFQDEEISRVKNRRRTALALEAEAPYHRLTQLMDDLEYYGRPRTAAEMLTEVDAVSQESIREYLTRFPFNTSGHLASVGPRRWPSNATLHHDGLEPMHGVQTARESLTS